MASDLLLRALRREPVDRTPVWFMRQAGRYLPEYRELRRRSGHPGRDPPPGLAVEITLQPLRRYGVDAAILFSDIVVPLVAVGLESGSCRVVARCSTLRSATMPTSTVCGRSSRTPTSPTSLETDPRCW